MDIAILISSAVKELYSEVFQSICCGIGIILIIPITAIITSRLLLITKKKNEDIIFFV